MRHIHNTTFLLPEEKEKFFVDTIKEKILPRLRERGIVVEPLFTRVFVEEQDGAGFSLQLIFPDEKESNHAFSLSSVQCFIGYICTELIRLFNSSITILFFM